MRRTPGVTGSTWTRPVVVVAVVLGLVAAACGGGGDDGGSGGDDSGGGPVPEGAIVVPDDHDTIQAAVDAASEGDLVYVREGTYNEGVIISTPNIVLRGADRNETVIDGDFEHDNCVMVPETNGVAVENLTVTNCNGNGVYFTGVDGYRVSYVSSIRSGIYGIYAFDSVNGRFEHSYASGSPDAGFYIGKCDPCNAVLDDVTAEWNGLGYSGTNASGTLIINSTWRHNRTGIAPNSLTSQRHFPQHDAVIVGNHVHDNNNGQSPAIDIATLTIGMGVAVAGGNDNVVTRNLIEDHDVAGVAVFDVEEILRPRRGVEAGLATGNAITDNVITGSPTWGVVVVPSWEVVDDAAGNCASGNDTPTTGPPDLETVAPCDAAPTGGFTAPAEALRAALRASQPEGVPVEDADLPAHEGEQMPDADSAPPVPATPEHLDLDVDVDAIATPARDEDG